MINVTVYQALNASSTFLFLGYVLSSFGQAAGASIDLDDYLLMSSVGFFLMLLLAPFIGLPDKAFLNLANLGILVSAALCATAGFFNLNFNLDFVLLVFGAAGALSYLGTTGIRRTIDRSLASALAKTTIPFSVVRLIFLLLGMQINSENNALIVLISVVAIRIIALAPISRISAGTEPRQRALAKELFWKLVSACSRATVCGRLLLCALSTALLFTAGLGVGDNREILHFFYFLGIPVAASMASLKFVHLIDKMTFFAALLIPIAMVLTMANNRYFESIELLMALATLIGMIHSTAYLALMKSLDFGTGKTRESVVVGEAIWHSCQIVLLFSLNSFI
ncbi:MAG: hypothetical protein AAFR71_09935 [Pseudomonadota bacterium]